jgi:hypothetical protein
MGSVRLYGATSGYLELQAPDVSPNATLEIPSGGFGKVLQVVRVTDATESSTSSSSFVDVTGMSVTITPQKADSNILLIFNFSYFLQTVNGGTAQTAYYQIADSSNSEIQTGYALWESAASSAGRSNRLGNTTTMFAFTSPGSTSPVTYKLRFRVNDTNGYQKIENDNYTGQIYAIEVAA